MHRSLSTKFLTKIMNWSSLERFGLVLVLKTRGESTKIQSLDATSFEESETMVTVKNVF